jgi:hypothetical protein
MHNTLQTGYASFLGYMSHSSTFSHQAQMYTTGAVWMDIYEQGCSGSGGKSTTLPIVQVQDSGQA